ncbi:MAG: SGNH/GDSL hydrolase family protein [Jatrophihabitantaceae bacterium]
MFKPVSKRKATAVTSTVVLLGSLIVLNGSGGAAATPSHPQPQPDRGRQWANTWMTPTTHANLTGRTNAGFNNQSARMIVHTTVSGAQVRIRLSNEDGEQAMTVGHATVAKADLSTSEVSDIDPATLHQLRFGGQVSAVMNKGADLLSDPVDLAVGREADLVITVFYPTPTGPITLHATTRQASFYGPGDLTGDVTGAGFDLARPCCWINLAGVDVLRHSNYGPVVVFGDSLAEANGSTFNANQRWPNLLYTRLAAAKGESAPAVLNASLSGARLNHEGTEPKADVSPGFPELGTNALARMDDDIFDQTHVGTVITDIGICDIWMSDDTAEEVIASLRQVNQQIKEHGMRSLVATFAPYKSDEIAAAHWTPAHELRRQAVNEYLRNSDEFDGLIDFDKVLRNPADPERLLPAYDSGDHFHPNDLGNQAMADAIDLSMLLRAPAPVS